MAVALIYMIFGIEKKDDKVTISITEVNIGAPQMLHSFLTLLLCFSCGGVGQHIKIHYIY